MNTFIGNLFFLFVLLLFSIYSQAQHIEGRLIDKVNNQPVPFTQITVVNTVTSILTDEQGKFSIQGLKAGKYTLRVQHAAFQLEERHIDLAYDEASIVDIYLTHKLTQLNEALITTAHKYKRVDFFSSIATSSYHHWQLSQAAPRSSQEALYGLSGLWLQQNSSGIGAPIIRGLSGNRTLIMLDGIRLNSAIIGNRPWSYLSTIDPESLNRIELIRGSGATQYGSSAMGGVVQLFTESPDFTSKGLKVHGEWQLKYLSQRMEMGSRAELQLNSPRVAVLGGISYSNFGDVEAGGARGQLVPSGYKQGAGDLKALFKLSPHQKITLAYQFSKLQDLAHYEQVAFKGFESFESDPLERQLAYARWEAHSMNKWFQKVQFTGSYQQLLEDRRFKSFESDIRQWQNDQVASWGASFEVHSQPIPKWNIVSGIDYYQDQVSSSASRFDVQAQLLESTRSRFINGSQATNLSIFSTHTLDVLKLHLSFGGRANIYSIGANEPIFNRIRLSPEAFVSNFSALYPLSRNFHMVASLNSGYRMPNLYDLSRWGTFQGGFEVPNQDIGPEKSFSTEFGIKAKTPKYAGSIVVYRSRLSDLMQRVPGFYQGNSMYQGQRVFMSDNVSQAFVQGIEAELEVPLSQRLLVYGHLNYTYGEEVNTSRPMSYIPPLYGKAGLRYQDRKGFWGKAEWFYAAEQDRLGPDDIANPFIAEGGTAGWQVANVFVGYDIGYDFGWCSASIGVLNVLDTAYRMSGSALDGYGRSVRASLRLRF